VPRTGGFGIIGGCDTDAGTPVRKCAELGLPSPPREDWGHPRGHSLEEASPPGRGSGAEALRYLQEFEALFSKYRDLPGHISKYLFCSLKDLMRASHQSFSVRIHLADIRLLIGMPTVSNKNILRRLQLVH